ncbi:MAG: HAMP domain-containing protein, partial [Deltaproteobacteria bacterium]|nr:HAMP domain-containing protein [Deltaproteobacteria bacterium]
MMKLTRMRVTFLGKLNIFIGLGIGVIILNFPIVYYEINSMNQRILSLELTEDLYNTILEMRRYEKNLLLYNDSESLTAMLFYLNKAKKVLAGKLNKFQQAWSEPEYIRLKNGLEKYTNLDIFKSPFADRIHDEKIQAQIREVGKDLVESSRSLLKTERHHIAYEAQNALRWPLIFMGCMFFLFLLGVRSVTKKVIKPLRKIVKATENVAKGDFRPISLDEKMESAVDLLVAAFNRMAKELEAREEKIVHSRKIASLGTLVSGIAHELNNPINNIVLTVDSLISGRKIPEEKKAELLDDI